MNEIKEIVIFKNITNNGYYYLILRIICHDEKVIDIPLKKIDIRKENKK